MSADAAEAAIALREVVRNLPLKYKQNIRYHLDQGVQVLCGEDSHYYKKGKDL